MMGQDAPSRPEPASHYWSTRYAKHPKLIAALDKPIPDALAGVVATNLRLPTFTRTDKDR
jgi:hypothetical protein